MNGCVHNILLAAMLLCLSGSVGAADLPPVSPPEMEADATLKHITFIDPDTGWAVGDRGVIWHTGDGGRHWERQASPVSCSWEQVQFLNHQEGWILGGWPQAYGSRSQGVILHTTNGGATWQQIPGLTLPALIGGAFFSKDRVQAWGDSSSLFPGGTFTSHDGGRTWQDLPALLPQAWRAAAVRADGTGLLVGVAGEVATLRGGQRQNAQLPSLAGRRPRAVHLHEDGRAWLVGERGLVLRSDDHGQRWRVATEAAALSGLDQFDFHAVARQGEHVWIVGNPGSRVLHSSDLGTTWEWLSTEQPLPLCSVCFLDADRGWAAGAMGTVLATRDGGRSWRVQRQGGSRAALLVVGSEPGAWPRELVAHLAGNEAWLTAVEFVAQPRGGPLHSLALEQRAGAEAQAPGVSWVNLNGGFPVSANVEFVSPGPLAEQWKTDEHDDPLRRLEALLVCRLRQWRPDVVVAPAASPHDTAPLDHLVNQATLVAVQRAADPTAYPEQLRALGLAPWKVKKVFVPRRDDSAGTVALTATQLAPRLGGTLADVADLARGYCQWEVQRYPSRLGFDLLIDQLPQGQGRRDFFSGITAIPGSDCRRAFSAPTQADLTLLARRVQNRQTLQKLFERSEREPLRSSAALAEATAATREFSAPLATRSLQHLAQRYAAAGESEFAAQSWQYMLERYPESDLADRAATWLVHHYGSLEQEIAQRAKVAAIQLASGVATASERNTVQQAVATAGVESIVENRPLLAASLGKQQEMKRPLWFALPEHRFAVAHALRRRGETESAQVLWRGIVAGAEVETAWSLCAAGELWLAERAGMAPRPQVACARANQKPRLDGRLDDPLWQQARPAAIGSNALVAFACDEEFLFVALSCQKRPGVAYPAATEVRQRDAQLQLRDRVELLFDVDRDHATSFCLGIDYRGWTHDACGDDATWDPTWFVASGGDDQFWTCEAAVEWNTSFPRPKAGEVWSLGLVRRVPNAPLASWSQVVHPTAEPSGFGWLEFPREDDAE